MEFESELNDALAENVLVLIAREQFDATCPELEGLVFGVSDLFLSMAILDERVRFNGIEIFCRDHMSDIQIPAPHATFYESALRLRGDRAPEPPPLDLASMRSVLESISKIAPLVVIHRELQEPDVCEIGQITALDAETFELREIDPDADWVEDISEFRYEDITRVGFAGDYEGALALVAGVVV
jgi:hypothetical protein